MKNKKIKTRKKNYNRKNDEQPSNYKSKGWMIDITGASETGQRIVLDHTIGAHTQLTGIAA